MPAHGRQVEAGHVDAYRHGKADRARKPITGSELGASEIGNDRLLGHSRDIAGVPEIAIGIAQEQSIRLDDEQAIARILVGQHDLDKARSLRRRLAGVEVLLRIVQRGHRHRAHAAERIGDRHNIPSSWRGGIRQFRDQHDSAADRLVQDPRRDAVLRHHEAKRSGYAAPRREGLARQLGDQRIVRENQAGLVPEETRVILQHDRPRLDVEALPGIGIEGDDGDDEARPRFRRIVGVEVRERVDHFGDGHRSDRRAVVVGHRQRRAQAAETLCKYASVGRQGRDADRNNEDDENREEGARGDHGPSSNWRAGRARSHTATAASPPCSTPHPLSLYSARAAAARATATHPLSSISRLRAAHSMPAVVFGSIISCTWLMPASA